MSSLGLSPLFCSLPMRTGCVAPQRRPPACRRDCLPKFIGTPPPPEIIFCTHPSYGRSLGSGPTCQLAEELAADGVELGGVMLQSPLASAFRVAFNFRFTMPGDLFPNIDRVKNVACPMFIIHGTRWVVGGCACALLCFVRAWCSATARPIRALGLSGPKKRKGPGWLLKGWGPSM